MSNSAGEEGEERVVAYDHERLDAYRMAIEFQHWRRQTLGGLRNRNLSDQLLRASSSIALNIAEAAGEESPGDRRRIYRYARRSASESNAALDVIEAAGLETPENLAAGKTLLRRLRAILNVLSRI